MDFLEGRDRTIVKRLEDEMQLAANQMQFEQAAVFARPIQNSSLARPATASTSHQQKSFETESYR